MNATPAESGSAQDVPGPVELSPVERTLVDRAQRAVPVCARPYAVLGAGVGLSEDEVIAVVARLRAAGILRRISGIFDTVALGYRSTLAALRVAPDRLDTAAAVVDGHPGVSHNYARDHEWNLWFTLAVPPDSALGLDRTVELLARRAGADGRLSLPAVRTYKIGVHFPLAGAAHEPGARGGGAVATEPDARIESPSIGPPDADEIGFVRLLQRDLAAVPEPFAVAASELGVSIEGLAAAADGLRETGRLRRFAAVLHHRRAGFRANGMTVWSAPADRVDEIGQRLASFPEVSHCYRRVERPEWPYSLYAMVHARRRDELGSVVERMIGVAGLDAPLVLCSTREYTKRRLTYFDPAWSEWERIAG